LYSYRSSVVPVRCVAFCDWGGSRALAVGAANCLRILDVANGLGLFQVALNAEADCILCPQAMANRKIFVLTGTNLRKIDFSKDESVLVPQNVLGVCLYHDSSLCFLQYDGLYLYSCTSDEASKLIFSPLNDFGHMFWLSEVSGRGSL
jgi:hypothetical protein